MDPKRFHPDVMLLAAGLGTRLRPLTETVPKPLVDVGGTALIDRVIAGARAEGLSRFAVNAHHLGDQVIDHVAGLEPRLAGTRFRISVEHDAPLDTGGGVKKALPLLETDPILVMNADSFWLEGADAPIRRMIETFAETEALAVLLCVDPARAVGFRRSHDFCLDPRRRITSDTGAPVVFAGASLLARGLFDGTPEGAFSAFDLWMKAMEAGRLFGARLDAPWLHVGDAEALEEAARFLAEARR